MSEAETEQEYFDVATEGQIVPPEEQLGYSRSRPIDVEAVRRHIGRHMIVGREALQHGIEVVQDSLAEGVRKVKEKYGKEKGE